MIHRIESAALLVRSVPYSEADIIATFFTRDAGKLSAIVRGARRSTKRFGGALEPIHELTITLEDKGRELCVLKEARVKRPRLNITSSLEAMEAAGQALRWVRHLCPPRTPEPAAWRSLEDVLEALDAEGARSAQDARRHLAIFGLRLVTDMGYAIELDRCVRCGRPCPQGRSAFIDASRGGLVCTGCGGASRTMSGDLRGLSSRAQRGELISLTWEEAGEIVDIVEESMAAHSDFGER